MGSLAQLDALVGRHVTGEKPHTHWEDSHAQLQFESVEEALEALREPYFQQFIPEGERASTVLHEIQEFRPYSADLAVTLEVVQRLASEQLPLHLWRKGPIWHAAFGECESVMAETAAIAICVAALRVRGCEVKLSVLTGGELGDLHPDLALSMLRCGMLAS